MRWGFYCNAGVQTRSSMRPMQALTRAPTDEAPSRLDVALGRRRGRAKLFLVEGEVMSLAPRRASGNVNR